MGRPTDHVVLTKRESWNAGVRVSWLSCIHALSDTPPCSQAELMTVRILTRTVTIVTVSIKVLARIFIGSSGSLSRIIDWETVGVYAVLRRSPLDWVGGVLTSGVEVGIVASLRLVMPSSSSSLMALLLVLRVEHLSWSRSRIVTTSSSSSSSCPDIALLQDKLIGVSLLLLNLLVGELINTLFSTSIQIIKLIDVLCNIRPSQSQLLLLAGRSFIIFVFKLSGSVIIISVIEVM